MAESLSNKVRNVVVDCIFQRHLSYMLFLKCNVDIAPIE